MHAKQKNTIGHQLAGIAISGDPAVLQIPGSVFRSPIKYPESLQIDVPQAVIFDSKTQQRIGDIYRPGSEFSVENENGKVVAIFNPKELTTVSTPIPVRASIFFANDLSLAVVKGVQPESAYAWGRLISKGDLKLPSGNIKAVNAAFEKLNKESQPLIHGVTNEKGLRHLQDCYADIETELASSYKKAVSTEDKQQIARTLLGVLREKSAWNGIDTQLPDPAIIAGSTNSTSFTAATAGLPEKKAFYSTETQLFRPEVYKKIYEASRACVGIGTEGGLSPFATGAFIGNNLILTCGHEVNSHQAGELRIYLSYEIPQDPWVATAIASVKRIVFRGQPNKPGQAPLDFTLLEMNPLESVKNQPYLTINTKSVGKDTQFFLVGHPNGLPRTVSDNAKVYFPFEIDQKTYNILDASIDGETSNKEARTALKKSFKSSYKQEVGGDLQTVYHYYSPTMLPEIGAICSTSHGNSGSPAMLRTNAEIFGILINGMADTKDPYPPGWGHHEGLLPVSTVIEQLDGKLKGWREKYHVHINEPPPEENSPDQ